MESNELIELWKVQNQKIEQNLQINKQLLLENLDGKAKSMVSGFKTTRKVGIIFGVIWCLLMGFLVIVSWSQTNWYFKAAFIIHIAVSVIAIGLYIYHLILLDNFNNNQSVVYAQEQLHKLEHSNLKTIGILWLQLPVFSIWFMSDTWMKNDPTTFWGIQMPLVVIQAIIGIWLYRNLNFKNHDKKWFRWFMSKGEFGRIKKANEFLKEMDNFKQNG